LLQVPRYRFRPNSSFGIENIAGSNRCLYGCPAPSIAPAPQQESISLEYILTDPERPTGVEGLKVYSDADKRSIGRKTFHPQGLHVSISTPGAMRFQFGLLCPHEHTRTGYIQIPELATARGSGARYVRERKPIVLASIHTMDFGDRKDASGVTVQEFQEKVGRVGMAWAYVAEWELVR
jgi:hypothetical protein